MSSHLESKHEDVVCHFFEMKRNNDFSPIVNGACPCALYDPTRFSYTRAHLPHDSEHLSAVKAMNKELKQKIRQELESLYGDEWHLRFPVDVPVLGDDETAKDSIV